MLLSIVSVFLLSLVAIWALKRFAPKIGLVDIPNERSVHSNIVPRGAGIGIFIAFILTCCLFEIDILTHYPLTFLGFSTVFFIGVLDDLKDASPKTKFLVIFIATTLAYFEGIGIHSLGTYFGFELTLGWLALPFTLFAVSGFTNALNLIDGIDGLSGTISILILGVLFFIGYQHHDTFITHLSLLLITALAAFLLFNWNPASIFLGDSGSLTVGFIISILSIKALDYIHPALILFLAAIPIFDTLIVMIRRKRRGGSAFAPDKTHLHHILLKFFNGNVKKTVIALALLQLIYSMTGFFLMEEIEQSFILILFGVNYLILYIVSSTMLDNQQRMKRLKKKLKQMKKGQVQEELIRQ
jgi:UDP-GlcNAc:undecaprenyl-phosphate GlcNAc-1-phosphate transferase